MAVMLLLVAGPSRMSQMNAEEESAHQRIEAWETGFQLMQRSPLWGIGKDQFKEHHYLTAHNSIVLCLAELGIAGTMAWIGLFYFVFRDGRVLTRLWAQRDAETPPVRTDAAHPAARRTPWTGFALLQISLITFLVGAFFLSRTYTPPLFVYLALAVAAGHAEARTGGHAIPPARPRDVVLIGVITLGAYLFVRIFIQVVG
jgi:O-antigen ligase